MLDFLKKLFGGDKNERAVKKLWPRVAEINEHFAALAGLSDDDLRARTDAFRAKIREAVAEIEAEQQEIARKLQGVVAEAGGDGQEAAPLGVEERHALYEQFDQLDNEWHDTVREVLDELLPEAFAVVKEACRRHVGREWTAGGQLVRWDMVPFDVQLLGGMVLHQGNIAEMKTGEGKTLVALAPLYLNALAGRGAHLVTVNPYLAQRDAEWMGPIFRFLGLTVDVIDQHEPHTEARRRAYAADITYGTNNEFGFDYLRDNSFVSDPAQLVQRDHYFAIVDEVDSVLIDEARTPLIISGPVPESDDSRFDELNPPIRQLVQAQQRLVAQLVAEAEKLLAEAEKARTASENKRATELEDQAGLALLRASRGFPKNGKLRKLLQEPGVERLRQQTESFYLQDNAKRMPEVDEYLFYALDEKQRSIEMTEKGRESAARTAGSDKDLFVLPDMGEGVARLEAEYRQQVAALDPGLEAEARAEALRTLQRAFEDARRSLNNLYSDRAERLHAIEQLLRAYTLYEKDVEYIVQEDKVMIVDEHTGRVLPGRRYSDGLHQAIEAKENVKVQGATQTYATITLQNYFRMYAQLAGMTGTAETEAEEFYKIYKMDVVVIPTNKPVTRQDLDDLVYKTRREKYNAVLVKIREYHEKGQPVLVGTTSVEVSETLSRMLQRQGIKHNVLNAKLDRAKQEALIVAEAGQRGAVTIATNMAGRGTDIKLGEGIRDLGGLAILGTERHESRRIDLQLRGRSGRQGDPGESQFYVSLEDNLMRLFGSDRVIRVMDKMGVEEGEVITHPWVNKSIERAQKKVEQNNFSIRKRQLEYDDVLNAQRQVIYDRRMHALKGERLRGDILDMVRDLVKSIVEKHYGEGNRDEMREELLRTLALDVEMTPEQFARLGEDGVTEHVFTAAVDFYNRKREVMARPFFEAMKALVQQEQRPARVYVDFTDGRRLMRAVAKIEDALATQGQEINDALERVAMLAFIDQRWTEHLRNLDEVKEGIGLRAYGQRDPLVEYKMEAFKLFSEMIEDINQEAVSFIFRAGPLVDQADQGRRAAPAQRPRLDARRAQASHASAPSGLDTPAAGTEPDPQRQDPTVKQKPVVIERKIDRNEVVTIQNPSTGLTETLKYKYAEKKIQQGWVLVS
jgi:preprotein translocase subunit SecA